MQGPAEAWYDSGEMKRITPQQKAAFRRRVWHSYKTRGRTFSWRKTRDPYEILISEVMLQQTQTSRVEEKWPLFLRAFPTIRALAKTPQSDVLIAWQGLGYNRRAKLLKRLAEEVVRNHSGRIPKTYPELAALPGVGQSTAGAVLAFAFNIPAPFIETNIRRTYIHYFFPRAKKVTDKELTPLIEETLDQNNPREWFWALMDYGAALPQKTANPNRKSAHYKKQTPFAGSNREVRGAIIRFLAVNERAGKHAIARALSFADTRIAEGLADLCREGLITKSGRSYLLV